MEWVKAMADSELAEGGKKAVIVQGRAILFVRWQGRVYAMNARCPHMGGPLERGRLTEDGGIECPWHHSCFDLATGAIRAWAPWPPMVGAVLGAVKPKTPLAVYPTRVEQGTIEVGVGGDG